MELVAYFVSNTQVQAVDIRIQLVTLLPAYMIPAHFIQLDSIPLTTNGKVDRSALPAPSQQLSSIAYVAPENAVEEQLAAIWATVLGLDKIGVKDNFFDLGGNSFKLLKVVSMINKTFGRKVTIVQLFRFPNIAALATYITEDEANETATVDEEAMASMSILDQTLKAIR